MSVGIKAGIEAGATGRLSAERLAFGFPSRMLGRDLSFRLEAGDILGVLGPNGSGKTTLLRTLLGLAPTLAGTVRYGGASLHGIRAPDLARLAGYVPQSRTANFEFSVREVVMMGRSAHLGAFAQPGKRDVAVVERVLGELGLGGFSGRLFSALSGGEQQRVLIARALAQEASVLVMDEPTASLDLGNRMRVLATLRELAKAGTTIIFTTHDPDEAALIAGRAMLLHAGGAITVGAIGEVLSEAALSSLYGVAVRRVTDPQGRRRFVPEWTAASQADQ